MIKLELSEWRSLLWRLLHGHNGCTLFIVSLLTVVLAALRVRVIVAQLGPLTLVIIIFFVFRVTLLDDHFSELLLGALLGTLLLVVEVIDAAALSGLVRYVGRTTFPDFAHELRNKHRVPNPSFAQVAASVLGAC